MRHPIRMVDLHVVMVFDLDGDIARRVGLLETLDNDARTDIRWTGVTSARPASA